MASPTAPRSEQELAAAGDLGSVNGPGPEEKLSFSLLFLSLHLLSRSSFILYSRNCYGYLL